MNKGRRKLIGTATSLLSEARGLIEEASAKAAEANELLETARDEEQEYKDNMPENMQDGEKGSMADSAIDNLENAASAANSLVDELETSVSELQTIIDRFEGDVDSNLTEAENCADEATA